LVTTLCFFTQSHPRFELETAIANSWGENNISLSNSIDRIAKLILSLTILMIINLIAVPILVNSESYGDIVPYLLYSLFLTSLGVLTGLSMAWVLYTNQDLKSSNSNPDEEKLEEKRENLPMMSTDVKSVVQILQANNNNMWQAELVRLGNFTNSKASRLLSTMEYEGLVRRVRDGMGKRVELIINEDLI
jgi:uncharacterized membrane protein|tara:strand:- start:9134 stop:9703 length:570 start_codon:yes stop_codon:yes gene_type:complete